MFEMDPYILSATAWKLGVIDAPAWALGRSTLCSAKSDDGDNEGGGGGGDDDADPDPDDDEGGDGGTKAKAKAKGDKSFSQAEVTRLIAKEVAKTKRGYQKRIEALEGEAKRTKDLTAELEELRAQIDDAAEGDDGKGGGAKDGAKLGAELRKLQRQYKKLEGDLAESKAREEAATAAATTAQANLKKHIIASRVAVELSKHNALPNAIEKAVKLFVEETKADLVIDEDDPTAEPAFTMSYGGREYDDVSKLAGAWLKENPYLVSAKGAGTGSKPPNGKGGGSLKFTEEQLKGMTPDQLISAGLNQLGGPSE